MDLSTEQRYGLPPDHPLYLQRPSTGLEDLLDGDFNMFAIRHAHYLQEYPFSISAAGWIQTLITAYTLRNQKFEAIASSGSERANQTAWMLKQALGIPGDLHINEKLEENLTWLPGMFKGKEPRSLLVITNLPALQFQAKMLSGQDGYFANNCEGILIKGKSFKDICLTNGSISAEFFERISLDTLMKNNPKFAESAKSDFIKVNTPTGVPDISNANMDLIKCFDYARLFKLIQSPFGYMALKPITK